MAEVEVEDIKQLPDGTIPFPTASRIKHGGKEVWSVLDAKNCILQSHDYKLGITNEYYLNNMFLTRPMQRLSNGVFRITLFGDSAVRCKYHEGFKDRKTCYSDTSVSAFEHHYYLRLEKALSYIFSNFCTGAKIGKSF